MQLKKYLKINKLSYREFADRMNNPIERALYKLPSRKITFSSIGRWVEGRWKPNLESMKIIQTMTHGKVTMKDFLMD